MYYHFKSSFVLLFNLITITFIALALTSCKKESLTDPVLNATTTGNSSEKTVAARPQNVVVVKYGALIGAPAGVDDVNFQVTVADQLGISCLRERVTVPPKSLDTVLVPELNTKYKIVLNFSSPGNGGGHPVAFRTDLDQYKIDLRNILNTFTVMPAVAVIENEESNQSFYKGPAIDYINQLKAAIQVMHASGIQVTNGGLINPGINYLVYKDLLAQGKNDSALLFKQQTSVMPDSPKTVKSGAFTDTLLADYAKVNNLDFVNFHRKMLRPADTISTNQVINYLKKRTGKAIISNELGQFDTSPTTLTSTVRLCTKQGFPYMLWYSPDQNAGLKATPLQYPDATLTPNGIAYQNFIAGL